MVALLPDVRYRIQSVDFGTFLERRNTTKIVMRAMKEKLEQQWYFQINSVDGTYQIVNADDRECILNASLTGTGNQWAGEVTCENASVAGSKRWRLVDDREPDRPNEIYLLNADFGNDVVLVRCKGKRAPPLVKMTGRIRNIRRIDEDDDFRWKIVEVSPASLPEGDGKYRIRTLTGMAIHSEPGQNMLSIGNQERGYHRAWELKSLGNGKCTIKNVRTDTFLVTEKIDDDWEPVLSQVDIAPQWDIQSVGHFIYTISVPLVIDGSGQPTRLSLTLKDQTIILKPMKPAHNQLWYIEATNAPLAPVQPSDPFSGTEVPPVAPDERAPDGRAPQAIIPQLMEGEYQILNEGGSFLKATELLEGTTNDHQLVLSSRDGTYFTLDLGEDGKSGSGRARISYVDASGKTRYIVMGINIVGNTYYASARASATTGNLWQFSLAPGLGGRFSIKYDGNPQFVLRVADDQQMRPQVHYIPDSNSGYQKWKLLPRRS